MDTEHGSGWAVGSIDGLGEGPGFRKIRGALGVTAFGVNAIVLPPGYETNRHYHERQEELYIVIEGEIELSLGDERRTLGPGGLARVDAATVRSLRNTLDRLRGHLRVRRRRGRLRGPRRQARRALIAQQVADLAQQPHVLGGRLRLRRLGLGLRRDSSRFSGLTTKKKITAEMIRNEITALRKWPYLNVEPLIVNVSSAKSGLPPIAAISGVTRSATNAATTAPNAAPMTTATARSTTLPRRMNSRNSLSMRSVRVAAASRARAVPCAA